MRIDEERKMNKELTEAAKAATINARLGITTEYGRVSTPAGRDTPLRLAMGSPAPGSDDLSNLRKRIDTLAQPSAAAAPTPPASVVQESTRADDLAKLRARVDALSDPIAANKSASVDSLHAKIGSLVPPAKKYLDVPESTQRQQSTPMHQSKMQTPPPNDTKLDISLDRNHITNSTIAASDAQSWRQNGEAQSQLGEDGPVPTLEKPAKYKVLQNATVRIAFERESEQCGLAVMGEVIDIFEERRNEAGQLRVRCAAGWTSVTASDGRVLLEMVPFDMHSEEDSVQMSFPVKFGRRKMDFQIRNLSATLATKGTGDTSEEYVLADIDTWRAYEASLVLVGRKPERL
jgi:hypothetical protein